MLHLQNGGASIKPSARKSIHNHDTHCPFLHCEIMGRYRLGPSKRQEQNVSDTSREGIDEVDNVMSKMARASSPVLTRKNEDFRRKSLSSPQYSSNFEDNSHLLSKSSPAIFSPYSYCSDESTSSFEFEDDSGLYNRNKSYASTNSSHQSQINESINGLHNSPSRTVNRRNVEYETSYQSNNKSSIHIKLIFSMLIAFGAIVAMWYNNWFTSTEVSNIIVYDKYNFYNDLKGVGEKYQISDNSILQVRAGVATIFERQDTGSFIFAYNSDRNNFNPVNFNNFVNELASAAARYLRNNTKTVHHVVVDTMHLQVQTDKELMNEYLNDVDKTGVMLVKELDRIPSTLAMAFHYYCDEYNPLVKKSAIFFTLNMARCPNVSSEKYTHEKIEKCLADKWKTMPQDNIRPLLTRVVNVVIDVTSDF
ncbi:uncharacterized protein [Epargyreus clarus]|uniref:uncharacterized protein isoform X2 n=1 Tax=Epargyreus clarus TaxID=520877 RepID=UPI003C2AE449